MGLKHVKKNIENFKDSFQMANPLQKIQSTTIKKQ